MSTFLDDIARTLAQPMPRKRAVRLLGGALVSATVSSVVPRAARATLPCDCSPGENACGIPLGAGCTKVCCVQSSNFPKCCKWIGIAKPAPGCGTHPGGTFGGIVEKPRTVAAARRTASAATSSPGRRTASRVRALDARPAERPAASRASSARIRRRRSAARRVRRAAGTSAATAPRYVGAERCASARPDRRSAAHNSAATAGHRCAHLAGVGAPRTAARSRGGCRARRRAARPGRWGVAPGPRSAAPRATQTVAAG